MAAVLRNLHRMLFGMLMLAGVIAAPDASAYHPDARTWKNFAASDDAGNRLTSAVTADPANALQSTSATCAYGVQTDPNGLLSMRARDYHPTLGRFITQDPLGLSAGPNVYAYCGGNPVSCTDPSGLSAMRAARDDHVRAAVTEIIANQEWNARVLEGVQVALDVIGLIPFAGEVADGTNAAISASRGNYTDAALSLGAMVPFIGSLSTGVKVARKVDKIIDAEKIITRNVDHFADAAKASESAASKGFFDGTRYTDMVLTQMSKAPGEFHSFPESVAAFEKSGTIRSITGGDGVPRQMLEIPGSYPSGSGAWKDGVFQFMKEADGSINHRLFVPNKPPVQ